MQLPLVVAVASLVCWAMLVFIMPVESGLVHVLLAIGTTMLVRWWGERG